MTLPAEDLAHTSKRRVERLTGASPRRFRYIGLLAPEVTPADVVAIVVGLGIALFAAGFLVFATGCPRPPVLAPELVDALGAAEAGWRAAGLPEPGHCLRDARVEWAASPASFAQACGASVDSAASCLVWDTEQRGIVVRPVPVLVMRPRLVIDAHGEPAIHEALHALVGCTLERPLTDPYDGAHTDRRVWLAAGGASSAQARAHEHHAGPSLRPP